MTKQEISFAAASANGRLQLCAAISHETDRLATEAESEATRLRKEFKRARKAYRQAKQNAKDTAKRAKKARDNLRDCLDVAFRELALALQKQESTAVGKPPDELPDVSLHPVPKSDDVNPAVNLGRSTIA